MDKTDTFEFINGVPAYLTGKSAKRRNARRNCDGSLKFARLDKPRDVKYSTRGHGVTHGGERGIGRSQYEIRRIGACVTLDYVTEQTHELFEVVKPSKRMARLMARSL